MDQQPRTGNAGLPTRCEDARDRTVHGTLYVGIVKNDVGRFAAQFQCDGLKSFGRRAIDGQATRFAACECDLCDIRVGHKRYADLYRQAGHGIDDARREPSAGKQFHEFQRRGGGVLRWFDHHRIASGQQWRELPRQEHQRGVPRHDRSDHTDGFAPGEGEHARLVD
ncbi:hypothetical protein GGD67_002844 [Bradyrhizobium sp. IAR9]|nr:hypothetical protein [Bradyrhizobium sp. IAR9]